MPIWRSTKAARTLALALALWAGQGAVATAQIDQGRALAAVEASREIAAAINAASDAKVAPRMGQGRFAELFEDAFDIGAGGGGAAGPGELALLWDMQREAGEILRAYLLAGASEAERLNPAAGGTAASNFLTFLPEIGRIYDFRAAMGVLIAQGCARLAQQDAKSAPAIEALAEEQARVLAATVVVAGDHQLDPVWRKARLDALAGKERAYSGLLGKKRAQEIADRALAAAIGEKDPAVAAALKDFALAMLR